jgi:hypothetical protein
MAVPRRNKKILCFIDEYGTAGAGDLYLGAVMLPAAEAGFVDKRLSDLLEPNAGELHAARLSGTYVAGLLERLREADPTASLLMVNRRITGQVGSGPEIYGRAVIELVKIAVGIYKTEINPKRDLNNIELILDQNHQNMNDAFNLIIAKEREQSGKFRGVCNIARIDSAAARLLQLADLVASVRKLIVPIGDMRADTARNRFNIRIL